MTFLRARARRSLMAVAAAFCGLAGSSSYAALELSATSTTLPARQGTDVFVEFTVANTSAFTRENVTMTMVFPAGLNQYFESQFDGDCPSSACETGETVTWSFGSLPAGAAITTRFGPRIAAAVLDGDVITLEPTVTDTTTDTASTTFGLSVDSNSLFDLAMSEARDPATAGSQLTYELAFGHLQDTAMVINSTLAFTLPAGATFVSASNGGSESGGVVSWPLGFLSPGDSGVREVTVQLPGGLAAGELVRASAELFSVSNPADSATVATNTAIAAAGGLAISVEANPNPARAGEFLNIDLTVTNSDPFTRFGVTVTAQWPLELAQYFESAFDGDCASSACETAETVTFTFGDIPAGGSVTTNFAPRMSTTALTGSVMHLDFTAADISGQETRRGESLRVEAGDLFDVALSDRSDPATAGAEVAYAVNYALRADAGTVANALLRLPLPAGTSFVSASDGGTESGGVITWPLGILSPGDSGVRNVVLLLDGGLAASDVVEATVEMTTATASLDAAFSEANTVISAGNGLQVSIESNVNPLRSNERANIQLVVRNTDLFPRFGVNLTARYPEGFAQLFESLFDGDCGSSACEPGERLTWALGDIGAGDTAVVDLPAVRPAAVTDGTLANLYVQAQDTLGLQARTMRTLRAEDSTVYDLTLAEDSDPVRAGNTLTYTLTWGYRQDAASVAQTELLLPVPAGTTFVSATDGGVLSNGVVTWALGFVSPGDGGQRTATFTVDGGVANGSLIEAHADITETGDTSDRLRAESIASVTSASGLALDIETNPGAARTNKRGNMRLTVSNTDPFARFGVELVGRFPADIAQLFESFFDGDCGSSACEAGEQVTWLLGDIAAGESRVVDLPIVTAGAFTDGSLANLFVVARDDQGTEVRESDTVRLQSDTVYDVSLLDSSDPAVPGATINYSATYGMRDDAASVRNSRLTLELPPGVMLQSASDGFVQSGNTLTWDLGFLSPGEIGLRSATVMIDGGTAPGSVLDAQVDVFDITTSDERASAEAETVVRATQALALTADGVVFTAASNRSIKTRFTITNNDVFTRFGVALKARFPQEGAQLFESVDGFDGDCGSSACEAGEVVSWPLVDIPAGESVTVTLPALTQGNLVDGSIINLLAWVEDDQGTQARAGESFATGCIMSLDAECDGVLDSVDNCLGVQNADQADTDGDGIGNACDADLNNDCIVNVVDLGGLRVAFFATPSSGNWNPDADFNDDDVINVVDLGILRTQFFQVPGPSALPNACAP